MSTSPLPGTKGVLLGVSLAGILLGFGLGAARIDGVQTVSYDGAISYLAATGHQGEYALESLAGTWVPARSWQALWTPTEFGAFSTISEGLARHDIHPPLYFWILHIWVHVFGMSPSSGLYLNLLLMAAAAACVFAASRSYQCTVVFSAVAAAMFALSGATLQVLDEARPYMLLALASAVLLWGLGAFLRRRTWPATAAMGAAALFGFLVHYHFLLVIASGALVALFALVRERDWAALLKATAAAAVAAAAFLFVHPLFYLSFSQQREQAQPFSAAEVLPRISKTISEAFNLVLPKAAAWWITFRVEEMGLLLLVSLLLVVAVPRLRRRAFGLTGRIGQRARQMNGGASAHLPFAMFVLTFGAIAALYVLFLSPKHAMGPKYTALASPFLFVAIGRLLQWGYDRAEAMASRPHVLLVTSTTCALLAVQASSALLLAPHERGGTAWTTPKGGHAVIIDSVRRGELPPLLWHLPPEVPVYAAAPENLRLSPPTPVSGIDTLVYVSTGQSSDDTPLAEMVLSEMSAHGYTPAGVTTRGGASMYTLVSHSRKSGSRLPTP